METSINNSRYRIATKMATPQQTSWNAHFKKFLLLL